MRRAAVLALIVCACGTTSARRAVDQARARDEAAVAAHADEFDAAPDAKQIVVVQDGDVAATAASVGDALRAAAAKSPTTPHRFVFRPDDRGTPLYRMAYLAEGGVVAGRRFFADLRLGAPGGRVRRGERLAVELRTLDGAARQTIDAVYDPDFDGGLLVPVAVAAALSLERFEIPGDAEVQVALGRPFRARRATASADVASLAASGAVEVVYENTSPPK